jgi:DNA-binding GntR family transcriptional regulator
MPRKAFHRQSDAVYDELRRLIIRTELKPGSLIEEPDIMRRLDVGRTPLREALQRLVQDDLVRNVPRRGYFVTDTSAADLFHVFDVRLRLEGLGARRAAERATEAHLKEFEQLLEEGQAGIDAGTEDLVWNIEIDERFHLLVARASGNPYIVRDIARHYALSVRVLYFSQMRLTLVRDEISAYRALYKALRQRDPQAAEAAMALHLGDSPLQLINNAPAPINRSEAANNGGTRRSTRSGRRNQGK